MKIILLFVVLLNLTNCASAGEKATEAAYNGNINELKEIIAKSNPNVTNKFGWTSLMSSAESGNGAVVKYLISQKAHLNQKNENGDTALIRASVTGKKEIVEILLQNGANPDLRNKQGYSAMMKAVERGNLEIVKLILNANPNPNPPGIENTPKLHPLHLAAREGHKEILKLLLMNGADVETKDARGFTPLLFAIEGKKLTTVQTLLEFGANKNIISYYGDTKDTVLEQNYDSQIANFLKKGSE